MGTIEGTTGFGGSAPPKVRVLLADDVDMVRHVLKRILERDGRFEVVGEACDGVEAVELAAELQPQIVFLDLMMPKKDGATALSEIREYAPRSRIVVFTALGATKPGTLDADVYLQKGASPSEIITSIEGLIEGAP